jgi:hypothetical protein
MGMAEGNGQDSVLHATGLVTSVTVVYWLHTKCPQTIAVFCLSRLFALQGHVRRAYSLCKDM